MRLFVYLIYLGAVFGVGGLVYERIAAFEGHIAIAHGGIEQVVVNLSEQGKPFLGSHRNMPIDVIPFHNPRAARRAFDPDTAYDVQHLPFRLSLDEVEVLAQFPPRDLLDIHRRGEEPRTHVLTMGAQVSIGPTAYTVAAIRPWSGLVRNPRGTPMAAVSLPGKDVGWKREVLLNPDTWVFPQPDVALLFRWFSDEDAARAVQDTPPPAMTSGRWGVADGGRVHWLNTVTPGAGFVLDDGTEVTLARVEETPPRIIAAFEKDGDVRKETAAANTADEGPLRYEHPGLVPNAYLLDAWRDAAARVTAYTHGERITVREMAASASWAPAALAVPIRLDQVMAQALPVLPKNIEGEPLHEVVLQSNGDTLQLRERTYNHHDGLRLRYYRAAAPPRVRYHLRARYEDGAETDFLLAPGDTARVGAWVFEQDVDFPNAAAIGRLHARRTLGTPAQMAGMAMVVIGAFGLVIARFKPSRSHAPAPKSTLDSTTAKTGLQDGEAAPD
ncbi:MAG: hypothetical protein ACLFTT_05530 [Candidatus Hydrogenedentota bacterium]